jgi:hypothetical protein
VDPDTISSPNRGFGHAIDALNERMPHSVHERCSPATGEMNCFMFALEIAADDVRDLCGNEVFLGKRFVKFSASQRASA